MMICDRNPMKEFPVGGVDLSAQFEQIPDRAKVASDQVRAASQRNQDQLRTAASSARNRATAAAGRLQDNEAAGGVSPHWQDIRAKWQAHVAAVQSDLDEAGDEIEASYAIANADLAESYAMDAIGFAATAIDEAEAAALNAMYCRTRASLLNP
jgi:hypothetical protein